MLPEHLTAARRLASDAATAEVVEAMRARGVRTLLFKGPVLESWLYQAGSERRYGDIDLLVAPNYFASAERALAEMGFQMTLAGGRQLELSDHEHEWRRGAHSIDLHRGIWGFDADWPAVWAALTKRTEWMELGGAPVEVPVASIRALMAAVHAAQHGVWGKPLEDLRRALAIADDSMWREAATVARRVQAIGPFTLGLGLLEPGRELLERLALSGAATPEAHLRARGAVPLSVGFLRLAAAPTLRARAALLLAELSPSAAFMRHKYRLARQGRLGLLAAYAWRPVSLCLRAPAGWRAWREAEARARTN